MARVSLILAAFIAVTIAIVLVQPGGAHRFDDDIGPEVTRGGADLAQLAAPKPEGRLHMAKEVGFDPMRDAMRLLTVPAPDAKMTAPEPRRAEAQPVTPADETADTGTLDLPSTFLTNEGQADTASILSTLSVRAGPHIPESYTVGMGNTLAAISDRFDGTPDRQGDIRRLNPGLAGGALTGGQVIPLPRP